MRGKSPEVYGDGTQTRDFTYIADIVDANHSLLTNDSADGKTMNIGSTDNIDITTQRSSATRSIPHSISSIPRLAMATPNTLTQISRKPPN
jgi:nucleoside-diphosphate-sugar epimerase